MSDNHNPGVPECDLADGTIAALRARVAELQAELNRSDCGDRNHAGLEDVMTGARLPNAELGQNVAFLAGLLGAAEQKVRDLEAKLAEAHTDTKIEVQLRADTTACRDLLRAQLEKEKARNERLVEALELCPCVEPCENMTQDAPLCVRCRALALAPEPKP